MMHDLLREQLDRAEATERSLPVVHRVAQDECGDEMPSGSVQRQHMSAADSPFRTAVLQVTQREDVVRLHADRDASRSLVIALANCDADASVTDRVNRIHEDAETLIERGRSLDINE